MPASCTALTVLAAPTTPGGTSFDEQASDQSPGNKFTNDGAVFLYVRNTQAGVITVNFYADFYGAEVLILAVSIPGSGTENGVKILGPFPPSRFNDHSTTEAATTGSVIVVQASGSDGHLVFCPFRLSKSLLS